jgi:PEP-CTERM motif
MRNFVRLLLITLFCFVSVIQTVEAQELYAITGAGNVESILYQISVTSGQVQQTIGDLHTTHVTALAFQPGTGVIFGHISNSPTAQLITIDPVTAAYTVIGDTGHQVPDMTFRSDGTLFAWSKTNKPTGNIDNVITISTTNGQATLIGNSSFITSQAGLSFAPNGTLYLKNGNSLYSVDQVTGVPTKVLDLIGVPLFNALAFDLNGKPYSVNRTGGQSFLETFDMSTGIIMQLGEITNNGQSVNGVSALSFNFAAVPEPSSLALGALTLVGTGFYTWRRRKLAMTN